MTNNSLYSKILNFFESGLRVTLVKNKVNCGHFLHVSVPRNLLLDRIHVSGQVKSAHGNIKAITCNLNTVETPGNVFLINSSAKYLFSEGNVTIKQTNKIQPAINEIWANNLNIDHVKAKRISARYGNAIASRSSLNEVFGQVNVHLTNCSVEGGVAAGYGSITIKQIDGVLRTIGSLFAPHGQIVLDHCHVKGAIHSTQNARITNSQLSDSMYFNVDPRRSAILDLTDTQVDEQVHIQIRDSLQFVGEPPLGPLPQEYSILIKGNVNPQKIKLTSFTKHDYNISYHQTAKRLLIQGKLESRPIKSQKISHI